jgi:hypothetical protein
MGTAASWLGVVIGAAGLIAAYVFYRRPRTHPALYCCWSDVPIIDADVRTRVPDLTLLYRGQQVNRLTSVTFVLCNDGPGVVRHDDIDPDDPLRLVAPEGTRILLARILTASRSTIGQTITVPDDSACATVDFKYLDEGDGFVCELLHTGPRRSITLRGTIIGAPSGFTVRALAGPPAPRHLDGIARFMFRNSLQLGLLQLALAIIVLAPVLIGGFTRAETVFAGVMSGLATLNGIAYLILTKIVRPPQTVYKLARRAELLDT